MPPAGFGLQLELRGSVSGAFHAAWFTHVAAAGEPSSYAFTLSPASSSTAAAVAYRGVDPATPVDLYGSQQFQGASFVAPSITTTHGNDMLVAMFVATTSGGLAWVAPSGMQTAVDDGAIGMFDATQASAGASGDKQASVGVGGVPGIGAVDIVALTPLR